MSTRPALHLHLALCFITVPTLPCTSRHQRQNHHAPILAQTTPNRLQVALLPLAAAVALFLAPATASAKTPLSENTLLRRYVATDPDAILRYALPLPSERLPGAPSPPIRRVQQLLERLAIDLRARGAAGLITGRRDLAKLRTLLTSARLDILLDVPPKRRAVAAGSLARLEATLTRIEDELGLPPPSPGSAFLPSQIVAVQETLLDVVESRNAMSKRTNFDGFLVDSLRQEALGQVANIEELSVTGNGLPFRIPRRYNAFPRLIGRATVELKIAKNGDDVWRDKDNKSLGKEVSVFATLDGYSAPITAGNFVDLSRRGYYNNTRVLDSQKGFYTQLGEREDDDFDGFKDPKSGTRRQIPLEILVDGDPVPTYGGTLDELGVGDLQPSLPMSAYGAMAMVHSVEDPNDASSQFYFFLLDPTSYQASSFGGSALTGSLSTFGYVQEGREYLSQIRAGDKVSSVKIVSGDENFQEKGES